MKKTSVVILCYNEEESIEPTVETLVGLSRHELATHDCELIFIDNDSRDRAGRYLRTLCAEDHKIKVVFNVKNFGQFNSPCYEVLQLAGDATVLMAMDFRDLPKTIVRYIAAREEGHKIAVGIKTHSAENLLMYHLRSLYYKWIRKFSEVDQIEHFTGFELCDRNSIQVLRDLDNPTSFLRGIVAELDYCRKGIPYDQLRRHVGKTSNNLRKLYDIVVLSVTFYTKFGLRLATFLGSITLVVSAVTALIYLMTKSLYWDRSRTRPAPLLIDALFLNAVQIFFIGMISKYMLAINQHVMKRLLAVEAERLNSESEGVEEAR